MNTKSFYLSLFLLVVSGAYLVCAQSVEGLTGIWSCEAPEAPTEYSTGIIEITNDAVYATFTGDPIRYGSTIEKFSSDSLVFIIDDLSATCILAVESIDKMTGRAVWPDGESPLILKRKEEAGDID
jgi:hypothetical protein